MQKNKNQLIVAEDDYYIINALLYAGSDKPVFDRRNADLLQAELRKAKLVNKEDLPTDVVRLNSRVKLKSDQKDDIMEITLVTPDRANIKEKKISIMAPIGTALIGFRQGQQVKWQVPAGKKTFTIVEVINEQKNH
ncbi:nucleoside diphosphate kinase regulator [Flavitalea antarctica]